MSYLQQRTHLSEVGAAKAFLDSAITLQSAALAEVADWFDPDEFMEDVGFRETIKCVRELFSSGKPITSESLAVALMSATRKVQASLSLVATLITECQSSAPHLVYWCNEVMECWRARRTSFESQSVAANLNSGSPADEEISRLKAIANAVEVPARSRRCEVRSAIQTLRNDPYHAERSDWYRMSVGNLDAVVGSVMPGKVIVVGAAPSCGKSTLMGQEAIAYSMTTDSNALLFSLEMTEYECMARWAAYLAKTTIRDSDDYRHGVDRLEQLTGQDGGLKLFCGSWSIGRIETLCDAYCDNMDVGLVVVDYLQLVKAEKSITSREQQVADISGRLKSLAMKHRCVVMSGSQFNREGQREARPSMNHLRESGAIEQDADIILLLQNKGIYNGTYDLDINVAKNRNGEKGLVSAKWKQPLFTIYDPRNKPKKINGTPAVERFQEFDDYNAAAEAENSKIDQQLLF